MKENLRKSLTIMYSYTSLNEYFHNIKKQHIKLYHFQFVKLIPLNYKDDLFHNDHKFFLK